MAVDAVANEGPHVVHCKLGERAGIRATQVTRQQSIALVHSVVARRGRKPHSTQLVEKDWVDFHAIQARQQTIHPSTLLVGTGKVLARLAGHAGDLSFVGINAGNSRFRARAATTIAYDSRCLLVTIPSGAHSSGLSLSHNSSPKLIRGSRASRSHTGHSPTPQAVYMPRLRARYTEVIASE